MFINKDTNYHLQSLDKFSPITAPPINICIEYYKKLIFTSSVGMSSIFQMIRDASGEFQILSDSEVTGNPFLTLIEPFENEITR